MSHRTEKQRGRILVVKKITSIIRKRSDLREVSETGMSIYDECAKKKKKKSPSNSSGNCIVAQGRTLENSHLGHSWKNRASSREHTF